MKMILRKISAACLVIFCLLAGDSKATVPVDPGTGLQDNVDYIYLSGTTGLHARFSPLYSILNGGLTSDNILMSSAYNWTGAHSYTANMTLKSGADLLVYSDSGSTLKASIDGATGAIIGAPLRVGTYNLNLARATTSATGDSIKVQCGGSACSATNPGFVVMNGTTAGALTQFTITADITINLTGAHWGADTTGDLTGRILRTLFANDNGTLRTCVALLGGRDTLLTTDTNATASNIDLPEEVLCNTAVGSSTNTVLEFGYFRSDFDDTGGSSENLNTVQSGVNDVVTGENADGLWQPWNPTYLGFSAAPSTITARWTQIGRAIYVSHRANNAGTSSANNFTIYGPAKGTGPEWGIAFVQDNGTDQTTPGSIIKDADNLWIQIFKTFPTGNFTAANGKNAQFEFFYKVGPAASFIE